MGVARAAGLFGYKAMWAAGSRRAGRALVRALGSAEEDVRTVAGMLLVRGGERAAPLLEEALRRRESLPMVLSVLADLGDPRCEPEIRAFVDDPDPKVADAARNALRILELARSSRAGSPP
jgi:HEAT repeat protein